MFVALAWSANFLATKQARHVAEQQHLVETLDAYKVEAEASEQDRAVNYEEDLHMDQTHFFGTPSQIK